MTEKEMKERMKEIDKQRDALTAEKREYEAILAKSDRDNIWKEHKEFEGKCFISLNDRRNETPEIKAFKILRVLDVPNERLAECVTLNNGYEDNCFKTKAIKLMILPLWYKNTDKMVSRPSDPEMIDMYELVTEQTFVDLYNQYLTDINSRL